MRSLRTTGPRRLLLGAGYGASILTTAFIVWLIVATPGTGPIGQASDYLLILVCLNLVLLLALVAFVVLRVVKIARSRSADAGARLHLRFVFLFSLAAVAPAVIVALAFGFLNRGIDTWFSDRVKTSVENGAAIAKIYLDSERQNGAIAMEDMQSALQSDKAYALFPDRLAFSQALKDTLHTRGVLTAVYIIDRNGQILARAEEQGAPVYVAPSANVMSYVGTQGPIAAEYPGPDAERLVYPLQGYNGAQLYGVKLLSKGIIAKLRTAETAINDYRDTTQRKARAQTIFFMAYLEAVLLVLIGAIWVGTSSAESIALPVARLVQAADKIAGGDLNARVITSRQSEDIAVLSRAFNRMTSDLQSQQLALKSAGEEAESRRRFIETVLSEISAGIVGLDVLGHVSAINRHAANFLGIKSEDALGENLRTLAPEIIELLDKVSVQRVEEVEVDLVRRGETRRVRVRASGLETGGAVLTFDDITRLIAAQRNAAWKDVARRIAHEIKNPLTPIQLSAERLRKKYRGQITTEVEVFDRLTEPYVTTREKGTGLGLAIVKRILEDHGGEFYLNDAVHLSGARAVLRLPRLQTGQNPLAANEGQPGSKTISHKMVDQKMVEI